MSHKKTYADRTEYIIKAVSRRRKKLREMVIKYKSGKCVLCGYNKYIGALEFHHKNDSSKNFGLSEKGLTKSWQKIKKESNKCILVCSNCHKEIHGGVSQLPKET